MRFTQSICDNRVFRRMYNRGRSAASPAAAVYCRRTGREGNRLGITVGVKLGKAVTRNLVRRRIREIYRTNEEKFARGFDIVVVARSRSVNARYRDLERDMLGAFSRLGIIGAGGEKR